MDYKVVEVKENLLIENTQKAKQLRDNSKNFGSVIFPKKFKYKNWNDTI